MKRKKLVSLLLVGVMGIGIVGCGENKKKEEKIEDTFNAPVEDKLETVELEENEITEVKSQDKDKGDVTINACMGGGDNWNVQSKEVTKQTSVTGKQSSMDSQLAVGEVGIASDTAMDYTTVQCYDVKVTNVYSGDAAKEMIVRDKEENLKPRMIGELTSEDFEYVIVEYNKIIPQDYEVDGNIGVHAFANTSVGYRNEKGMNYVLTYELGGQMMEALKAGDTCTCQVAFMLPKAIKNFSIRLGTQDLPVAFYSLVK